MRELLRRLRLQPWLTTQLLGASAMVNLLSFASPLFVMLILGQYVESGFDGTLVTLSTGMCIALLMQVAFRQLRTQMAARLSEEPDRALAQAVFEGLARSRTRALNMVPEAKRREIPGMLHAVQAAHSPVTVAAALDGPFALLFVLSAFAFSTLIGVLGLAFVAWTLVSGVLALRGTLTVSRDAERAGAVVRGLTGMVVDGADTVRAFGAAGHTAAQWRQEAGRALALRRALSAVRTRVGGGQSTLAVLARVLIYAVGAKQCVLDEMSFTGLIVANIFISRAVRQAVAFVSAGDQLSRAGVALAELREFTRIPLEPTRGTALRRYSGRLELRDLAFAHPGSSGPLFESLNLSLAPGSLTVFFGRNGSGKTTLTRLLTGVLEPMRGEILADGITLRQLAPDWWRSQLVYLPQEPTFLNGTIRDNVLLGAPQEAEADFEALAGRAGLTRFLSGLPQGADTPVEDAGRRLPLGVRRRIALARALATGGRLALLDEPFEGLDEDGIQAVGSAMAELLRSGATVLVFTHDPAPFARAGLFVNLNAKPVPEIRDGGARTQGAPQAGKENDHGR